MIDNKHKGKIPVALPTDSKIMPQPVIWMEAPWSKKIRMGRQRMFGAAAETLAPATITPVAVTAPVVAPTTAPVATTTSAPAVLSAPPTSAPAVAQAIQNTGPNISYNPNVATLNPAIIPVVFQQDIVKGPSSGPSGGGGGGGGGFMDDAPSGGTGTSALAWSLKEKIAVGSLIGLVIASVVVAVKMS